MKHKHVLLMFFPILAFISYSFSASVKKADFSGQFYPSGAKELKSMLKSMLEPTVAGSPYGDILVLVSPHAGYGYSGQTAAYGYKLISNKPYKTVIVLGTSHNKLFKGAAVYPQGSFETDLGFLEVDEGFTRKLAEGCPGIFIDGSVFDNEHSVEVQLPFLQEVLSGFKIVPMVAGDCSLEDCRMIASSLNKAIGARKDVLLVVSTDLYHGYDPVQADLTDEFTLGFVRKMDYEGLYYSLREGKSQACGGFGLVIALDTAKQLGYQKAEVLKHTNSSKVAGGVSAGEWTVGYASAVIYNPAGGPMLNNQQKKKLLEIARSSIDTFLRTGKKMQVNEDDSILNQEMGAFVTLNKHGQLRGCIGSLSASSPLCLTVRDMAVEAAMNDPRFPALTLPELKNIEIEISVLSPLKKVVSADEIQMGRHGVLVRRGYNSGVFLPQVAVETGWSKEEFMDNLCSHKAGLPKDAWRDKNTELYIFSADVFSEKEAGE